MLYRIVHSEPDLSLLPQALRPLFARCLAADPAERATPEEIVEWSPAPAGGGGRSGRGACRVAGVHRAGDRGPGAGTGADPGLPAAPGACGRVRAPSLSASTSTPRLTSAPVPAPGFPQPPSGRPQLTQEQRRARRRRTALITAAGVTGGALLVVALAWSLMDAMDRLDDRDKAGRTSATGPAGQPSASAPGSAPGSSSGSSSGASDASDPSGDSDSMRLLGGRGP